MTLPTLPAPTAPKQPSPSSSSLPSSSPLPASGPPQPHRAARGQSHLLLLLAFAFTVMADPISSVAYAIEAALRALDGQLVLLVPTMGLVVGVIALVTLNYHQLIARFPEGGGAAAAAGAALGEAWAFVPIGALVVDFVLTISISIAASASAIIAYVPALAGSRVPLALGLLLLVGGLSSFGHGGRTVFALMTLAFVGITLVLLAVGWLHGSLVTQATSGGGALTAGSASSAPWVAVLLAFPVAMALATGVEAPSSAIAQLGQLDASGRRRFGQITLWLTLLIVGGLTLGLTTLAVHLGIGLPPVNSTQIAEVARATGSNELFAAFQAATTLLLLAAASSSFQAGPGLLKALAHIPGSLTHGGGILPAFLGRTNRHHTPYWGLIVYLLIAAVVLVLAGAQDQALVLFYAVAVFLSFLIGLLAMAYLSKGRPGLRAVNLLGAGAVAFTMVMNLARGLPIVSLAVALLVAGGLYGRWVHAGRPRGIAATVQRAEVETE